MSRKKKIGTFYWSYDLVKFWIQHLIAKLFTSFVPIVRMIAELLSHKKLWLRASQFNLNLDRKMNKVLGIKAPLFIDWWLHESLAENECNLFSYYTNKLHFPSFLPKDYDEPIIGIGYGRYKEMEQIPKKITLSYLRFKVSCIILIVMMMHHY